MMSGGSKMILRAERNGIIIATMLACNVGSNYYVDRPIYYQNCCPIDAANDLILIGELDYNTRSTYKAYLHMYLLYDHY